MGRRVFVVGVGMTKFEKPGRRDDFDYPDMALEAGTKALQDCGISYTDIQQACVGYVYGDSTCGQRALYQLGLSGIPIYNVNNNCSTGSTALILAKQLVEGGISDCVMALGFEKMQRGSLGSMFDDRTNPMDKHVELMINTHGIAPAPMAPQMFGNAAREHMEKYGTTKEQLAKIAWKNHKHSINNPYSQFQQEYTMEQILSSPTVYEPLTKLQCCPTSDGGAAAIVCSEQFVVKHGLQSKAVEILGMEMATDVKSTFDENSCMKMVGYDMSKNAAELLYRKTGVSPTDVDVVELHDCFSANELLTYEALALCPPGKAGEMVDRGDNTYGGKYVINPSGGLISKGHPLGATGIAQCSELCWQLRNEADRRQVTGAKLALQHNIGLGGAVVVALYRLGYPSTQITTPSKDEPGSESRFKSAAVFDEISKQLKQNGRQIVNKVKGVFSFTLTDGPAGEQASWVVDAKNGNGSVKFDCKDKADCYVTVKDEDFLQIMLGKLPPQKALMSGRLKLKGNIMLAMKLKEFQPKPNKSKL